MPRLIDADALLQEDLEECFLENHDHAVFETIISNAPTIEAEPVRHGRWVHAKTYYESDECNCSLCGQLLTTRIGERMNYCPNCGARMDGGVKVVDL